MSEKFVVELKSYELSDFERVAEENHIIELSTEVVDAIQACRKYLEAQIEDGSQSFYGINTGFGSMYKIRIASDDLVALQHNLIMSHASGAGAKIPRAVARMTLLLKIVSLCHGNSGVRLELVQQLIDYFNAGLTPVMYEFGSLGASGDLAPLAHLAVTLTGQGAFYEMSDSDTVPTVLARNDLAPITLRAKEGLALINGTQFSTAYALWAVRRARRLLRIANLCAALSTDAFNGNLQPYDARIHDLRPHSGQRSVAHDVSRYLQGSQIASNGEKQLQDPYAFRCVPQVHGATLDTIDHADRVLSVEANSVTDNPLVFADTDGILSGGNFHAQPVALVSDFLAIAVAELGSISERRTYQLISGQRGLPDYLTPTPGVQSGLMITQYTAASIVNRNKILCTPASIDSIVTSKGQEDHVSMAANAATKLYEVCQNCGTILAIEFLAASQALEFRRPATTSPVLEQICKDYREAVTPFIEADQVLQPVIEKTHEFLIKMIDQTST